MALINDFMSLIYPQRCEACSDLLYRHEKFICNQCRTDLPRSHYHLSSENELVYSLAGRIPVVHAGSYFIFEKRARVQNMLHAIKYEGQKELAEHLGFTYAEELKESGILNEVNVIIPIPLHKAKLQQRGFNQSEWIARGISKSAGIPMRKDILIKPEENETQTRKNKFDRWENAEGVFQLSDGDGLEGKHLLLVDDVITTGATLESAWLCFKAVGNIKISALSLAFAKKI